MTSQDFIILSYYLILTGSDLFSDPARTKFDQSKFKQKLFGTTE